MGKFKEPEITRSEVVVVDSKELNDYGDLIFKDKGGNSHKISNKRADALSRFIVEGKAVELNYSEYMNKEYIYTARLVEDALPEPIFGAPGKESKPSEGKMSKEDWEEKERRTRQSIERQTSIKISAGLAENGMLPMTSIGLMASKLEAYCAGQIDATQLDTDIKGMLN